MFRWADASWLFGLLAVPALAAFLWWSIIRGRKVLRRVGDAVLVKRLTTTVNRRARVAKAVLLVGAIGLAALAMARPQFGTRVETVQSIGQDIVVAVDLSRSMLAEDISPSRLERARLSILRLMTRLAGDRIALVAFAGTAYLQSPLTADYAAAGTFLGAMDPEIMPVQGTDLGAALRVSLDALDRGAREARTVVVVTDGEDHEATLEAEMARAVESGVKIHAVGIGSPDGVPIPDLDEAGRRRGFLRDEEGAVVTSRLDEATLRTLAQRTGGRFVRVGAGRDDFDALIDEITDVEGDAVDERQVTSFEEQYRIFLALATILLFAEWMVPTGRRA